MALFPPWPGFSPGFVAGGAGRGAEDSVRTTFFEAQPATRSAAKMIRECGTPDDGASRVPRGDGETSMSGHDHRGQKTMHPGILHGSTVMRNGACDIAAKRQSHGFLPGGSRGIGLAAFSVCHHGAGETVVSRIVRRGRARGRG
jgi:hypothetical protein